MALTQFTAQVKEGLILELPQEAEALHLEPGEFVRVSVRKRLPSKRHSIGDARAPRTEPALNNEPGKLPRVSAMGKYAGLFNSEEFSKGKREEIALEDRSR